MSDSDEEEETGLSRKERKEK
jgi:ribosome biogenesis protein BMS1